MQIVDSRVRKCKDVSIIIDKKIRQRKIEYDRYTIPLNDSHPFELDEFVKILRKSDFEKIGNMLKSLKTEREQLKKEINDLTILLETQRNYIASLESTLNNESKDKDKTRILKDLIKI